MTASAPSLAQAGGFTLVETAVALAVLGLIAAAAAAAGLGMFQSAGSVKTGASLTALADQVTAFAKARNRLPCPDTGGSGYEGLVAGSCPAGAQVGWFPYLAVGLPQPAPAARAIYGVYRAAGADLAASTYADNAALVRTLAAAAAASAIAGTTAQVYLAGDGAGGGAETCAPATPANPAFVILAPGEARGAGPNRVDGIYADAGAAAGIGLCFPAPTRATDSAFDDRAVAVGFYAMMAKLNP